VVDELAGTNERARYTERLVLPGGMVSNALVQVRRLGCRAELLSLVATMPTGAGRASLRAHGVSTRRLVLSDAFPTTSRGRDDRRARRRAPLRHRASRAVRAARAGLRPGADPAGACS
jgi:sugar/nucleoside kinase (ribokinase family)